MSSGKQVLLHFLKKYSQQKQKPEDLEEVSENLRVGFLVHGSTQKEMWHNVDAIEWGDEKSADGERFVGQGLKVKNKDIPFAELFEYIVWNSESEIPKEVQERFPNLTQKEYASATHLMSLILSSVEYWDDLSEVENNGKLDHEVVEGYLESYKKKLGYYREDPEGYF